MRSALHDTVEFEFDKRRPGGGRVICTGGVESSVIHLDQSQAQAVPAGAQLLCDFLDEFQADSEIAQILPDVRREIARERFEAGAKATIKQLRLAAGLSQGEFALAVGTSQSMISLIESRRQEPGERTIRKMAAALGVDFNSLMDALANAGN